MSVALLAMALVAPAARAELLPSPEAMVLPSEQPAFNDMMSQLTSRDELDSKSLLAALDVALAKLREPTKLRGFIQFSRSSALLEQDRTAEALDAIEESIRLLPNYSGPLIVAAWAYSYSDRPGVGADFLLRASHQDPSAVRELDDYEVTNLLKRLRIVGDERRVRAVSDRLLEIGWLGTRLSSRSSLALESIKRRVAEGDVAGARTLVPKLLIPGHSMILLASNAYKDVWPDVEQWAGPKLERQWKIYLSEARSRWTASKSHDALADYSEALIAAGHDSTVIRDILPLLSGKLDKEEDYDLIFKVSSVAGALARGGRWSDIDALYAHVEKIWPLGLDANALNVAGNHAKWLLYRGSFREALAKMDATIEDARRRGAEVNSDALGVMHQYRGCMLHELGRDGETALPVALASGSLRPSSRAWMYLCVGKPEAARNILIEALGQPDFRDEAIGFVQKTAESPIQSPYGLKMAARVSALQRDPTLLAEIHKHGRVLPYSLREGAPAEAK
jgi:tetratricopeptide (TPR) repeat protein